ncbi:MAG TPA: hypothetical protein VGH52_08930 [Gaiellaceae bacterium]|jgi:serine O-acetyltransferase
MGPRLLLNPSLQAVVLIRFAIAGPRSLHWFWRNILIWKHSIEVMYRPLIGPGLLLPHPFGITIAKGVRIGRGVTIMHLVSIGANLGSSEVPVIGDGVVVFAHSMIFGAVEIGSRSLIGAGACVDFDVPAGGVVRGPRSELRERGAEILLRRTRLDRE